MHTLILDGDKRDFLIWRQGSGNTIEICDIVIGSERRKGKGRKLVYDLYKQIPSNTKLVWAICRADNFIGQQFYEELRFRVVGTLRYFYQDGNKTVDAILFGRDTHSLA